MADLRSAYRADIGKADLVFSNGALETDDGLDTSVILSLFTDRRAHPDDVVPGDPGDRRGWAGDAVMTVPGDRIGSRLWLLSREKQTQLVMARAVEYAREALQWMIDDGIARDIKITAEIVVTGILGLLVQIHRPMSGVVEYRYSYAWEAQALRGVR